MRLVEVRRSWTAGGRRRRGAVCLFPAAPGGASNRGKAQPLTRWRNAAERQDGLGRPRRARRLAQGHSWLVIDRSRLRARFLERGRTTWSAPVGVGKQSTPTSHGLFWVTELLSLPPGVLRAVCVRDERLRERHRLAGRRRGRRARHEPAAAHPGPPL